MNSYDDKNTNNKDTNILSKTYLISSLRNHKNKMKILKDVNNFFDNEDTYLNVDSNIYVGKKPQGPRFNTDNEIIPYSYVGEEPHNLLHRNALKKPNSPIKKQNKVESIGQILKNNNGEGDILEYESLQTLYSDIKKQTKLNKRRLNEELLTELPDLIKERLKFQQKNLTKHKERNREYKIIENYLIKKTNKSREALLMTNIDSFQFKNAILNTINEKTPNDLKLGDYNWYFNLRRPKNFKGKRDCYINIRTNENPFWGRFFEKYPNPALKCRKPIMNKNYIKTFENNPYLPSIPFGKNTLHKIGLMSDLIVKGKNLIDFEKKFESEIPGKKRVYKKNQLDTMEESKVLTVPELEKYIHNITDNQTYANDFDIRELYKNLSGKSPVSSVNNMKSSFFNI